MARRPELGSTRARSATSISGKPEIQRPHRKSFARKLAASSQASSLARRGTFGSAPSSRGNMGAGARPRLGSALVDRHLAIVDPLFVRPLWTEAFLARQRSLLDGRVRRGLVKRWRILGEYGQGETDDED